MVMQEYEPLETLAPALFGNVQKWRHTYSGEYVAVKRLELRFAARKRSKSSERAVEEDLFTEIKTNLRVQSLGGHPNVLPLRDCIMEDEAVLLVLKFCERGELLDVVNTQRAAGQQVNVTHYFAQILRGAAFLHANDIAHRDLSLENVLVDERDCCQITDFGLATQCKGKMTVADVWALGVMLYAMVAARYPFREPLRKDDRFRLLEDFGVEYLLEKDEVDVTGKEQVVDLLKKLLVVDPAQRSTLAELESHRAFPAVEAQPEHSLAQVTVSSNDDTRQRARITRIREPQRTTSESEKNKQALASSAIKATAVASAPVTGNTGPKNPCAVAGCCASASPRARNVSKRTLYIIY
ncbi:Protein kinase-like domain [Phytophthora cactorum]|nr:Protein kinase-like domain [Phytophthora cactorum]